ncbi:MAG: protein kinase [Planctomycetota bacterium]
MNLFGKSETPPPFLGKYEILEKIAEGGMGIIYRVRHLQLKQIYALKVIRSGEEVSSETIARFLQESQVMAKLKHPGIVQIIQAGYEDGQYFFCMEYIEGQTLSEKIQRQEISVRQGLKLFQKILQALQYAHTSGIIHRDLKPSNIFITSEGEPKIGDFGLAKDRRENRGGEGLTRAGEIFGTPSYMSPEQVCGSAQNLDASSDIYSIGACLYETLTGQCPFKGNSIHELFYKIVSEEPIPPSQRNKKIHQDIDTIILKSLEKLKKRRYSSAKKLGDDLERFLKGYPIQAKATSRLERFKKWLWRSRQVLKMASVILILGLCFLGYQAYRQQSLRNQQALDLLQKSLESQEKAKQLKVSEGSLKKQLEHLLFAFDSIQRAFEILPMQEIEENRWKLGTNIIQLLCNLQEYGLAEYIARHLTATSPKAKHSRLLFQEIQKEKEKKLTQHLESFKIWNQKILEGSLEIGELDEAIFEISQMPEDEIYQQLLKIMQEGNRYFSDHKKRSSIRDFYYQTMVEILGRLEHPKSAEDLYPALTELCFQQINVSEESNIEKMGYLIKLMQALGNVKNSEYAEKLQQLRKKMQHFKKFWNETAMAYQKLINPDQLQWLKAFEEDIYSPELTAEDHYLQGILHFNHGREEAALNSFQEALQKRANFMEVYFQRGLLRTHQKRFEDAIKDFQEYLKLAPQSSEGWLKLSDIYLEQNEADLAIPSLKKALSLLKGKPYLSEYYIFIYKELLLNRLEKRLASAQFDILEEDFSELRQLDEVGESSNSVQHKIHRMCMIQGDIFKKEENWDSAISCYSLSLRFEKEKRIEENLYDLLLKRCMIHIKAEKIDKAIQDLQLCEQSLSERNQEQKNRIQELLRQLQKQLKEKK